MQPPRIGLQNQSTFNVREEHTICFAGLPPVLATPWLVWFLEHAALDLLTPLLDEGELTVGTQIELEHLNPALTGSEVICRARVINVDGPLVSFAIEASADNVPLAKGLHRRRVVDSTRLAKRLQSLGGTAG